MVKSFNKKTQIVLNNKLVSLDTPMVMGILNVTPDSFFDGGKYYSSEDAIKRVDVMLEEGADIIDIGAWSSRPGAVPISQEDELQRLLPVLDLLRGNFPELTLSVDTYRSGVAERAVNDYGVSLINDVSAGEMDERMFEVVAKLKVPYIMMHMQGTPGDMQTNPFYENILMEMAQYFARKVQVLRRFGVTDILLDPGFGFGKTLEHNYELLSRLDEFKVFELPIVVGMSRKSMIYKALDSKIDLSLNGTTAANMAALMKGADILRVHDVKEARECIDIFTHIHA